MINIQTAFSQVSQSAWDTLPDNVKKTAVDAKKQASKLTVDAQVFAKNHLTPAKLAETTKNSLLNAATAKIFPFSDPPGWKDDMFKASRAVQVLRQSITKIEKELDPLNSQIKSIENYSIKDSRLKPLYTRRDELVELLKARIEQLDSAETRVRYLDDYRAAEIKKRLAGYLGMALNAAVPGTGVIAGTFVTAQETSAQYNNTEKLPQGHAFTEKERKNMKLKVAATVACSVASLAGTFYVIPIVKETIFGSTPT